MASKFPSHQEFPVFGSKNEDTNVITPVELETAFQTDESTLLVKSFKTAGFPHFNLDVKYTVGSGETGTSIEIQLEASPDNVNWYRLVNEDANNGISTITPRIIEFTPTEATGTVSIPMEIAYNYMRVAVKEADVVVNAGTVYGEVTLSGK